MHDSSSTQELRSQVMCGLRNVMAEQIGTHAPFDYDASIVDYLKEESDFDELDLMVVTSAIEEVFGIHVEDEAWRRFLGLDIKDPEEWTREVAPTLTFGRLAEFILDRLGPVDFSPMRIFGRACATAGAFRGIESIANQVDPFVERFAPSTSVIERFTNRNLSLLWQRLRWRCENRIPSLKPTARTRVLRFFGTCFGLTAATSIGAALLFDRSDEYLGVFITCFFALGISLGLWLGVVILAALVSPLVRRIDSGIPCGIDTFGDLARHLAAYHEARAYPLH